IRVFAFYNDDKKEYFYVDEAGTVWQSRAINLTNRLVPHNISTSKPVLIRYWEPVLKVEDGVGTEWEVLVDTTITAKSFSGEPFDVRYYYSAKARYEGWGHTAIPESQSIQEVLDVNWYDIDNFIVNETTNDSLFVKRGTAHYYFDPELGMIKYITDYVLRKGSDSYIDRYGTWELVEKKFPTDGKSL
nr:hypothetical protein [candidate division KSB1 bacterium]NIR68894.1 hypothetical protein [candidate division KSB1 bacterium]NIS25588.1 hypothetical protein [candidate division KSB1 bacterium]NIT72483.1 hypothetical protein [candidate division KSB1 bacterium]NIU26263.1 hypothetical protein [candidate division KSB1 bacterium]